MRFLDHPDCWVHPGCVPPDDPDMELRFACFVALQLLRAEFGEDIPYLGGLDRGFKYDGSRVAFLNPQKGIHRAACQRGPAALSIKTSINSPYDDGETDFGFRYDYREQGGVNHADNKALRAAFSLQSPLAYFVGSRPNWYTPIWPIFIAADHSEGQHVIVTTGEVVGLVSSPAADEEIQRIWRTQQVRARLHQNRFRGLVIPAYHSSCAICRLKEIRLLDAAHIVEDSHEQGIAAIRNGLSLCSIHHRAFDANLVGVDPDFRVRVARRLREDEDGPMLELLKGFHDKPILMPEKRGHRPDRDLLAMRYEKFDAA